MAVVLILSSIVFARMVGVVPAVQAEPAVAVEWMPEDSMGQTEMRIPPQTTIPGADKKAIDTGLPD